MEKLSKESIALEALALMDEQGEKALTMRALGKRLGVSAMSVYTYYSSREEMVAAAMKLVRDEYDDQPIPGEFWEDTVWRITASIRAVTMKHARSCSIRPGYDDVVTTFTRRIYQIHHDQGMPLDEYRSFYSMAEAYLSGFISKEIEQLTSKHVPVPESDPDYEWMSIAEQAYSDKTFRGGISLIIKGMHLMDPEGAKTWRTPEDASTWTWK